MYKSPEDPPLVKTTQTNIDMQSYINDHYKRDQFFDAKNISHIQAVLTSAQTILEQRLENTHQGSSLPDSKLFFQKVQQVLSALTEFRQKFVDWLDSEVHPQLTYYVVHLITLQHPLLHSTAKRSWSMKSTAC